jgi:autocrine motility factor receptor
MRSASHSTNDFIANILAMAETVREVLPHVPDELILQVLFELTFIYMSPGSSFVP